MTPAMSISSLEVVVVPHVRVALWQQGIYWGDIPLLNTRWVLQAQFMDSSVAHQELQQSVLGQGYGDRATDPEHHFRLLVLAEKR